MMIRKLFIVLFLILATPAAGAITFDSADSANHGAGTTITVSATIANQSNRLLVVAVSTEKTGPTPVTVTGVTFDGDSLTQILGNIVYHSDPSNQITLWYLLAPNITTADVIATMNTSVLTGGTAAFVSLYNVKQQAPEDTDSDFSSGSGSDTSSITINTQTDNAWIVEAVANSLSTNDMTAASGQTERTEHNSGQERQNMGTEAVASASEQIQTWTFATRAWGMIGASFEEEGGAVERRFMNID